MSRKKQWEIKDGILNCLESYPMKPSQIADKIGTNQNTVQRHLEELEALHKVQRVKIHIRGEEKERWQLVI
jgi:predicted ArsR family transcriptional regulator